MCDCCLSKLAGGNGRHCARSIVAFDTTAASDNMSGVIWGARSGIGEAREGEKKDKKRGAGK